RDAAQLRIDLVVTQKSAVVSEIERLGPLGLAPSGVDVEFDGLPAGLNLLPHDLRHRIVNRRSRLNMMTAAASAILLIFVMGQSIWLRQHQITEVEDAIDEVREEAMLVQELRDRIADASEAAGFMQEQRSAALPTVKVLTEVTRILPDDTFLDRLIISVDSVQMQGKSQNAQQLIEMVNTSPNFSDAAFRGPTRLDTRTQKEVFDINAKLVIGDGS
ncbi:MAG: general secretion pathway protein L, partial [Lysobacterales bacterium]